MSSHIHKHTYARGQIQTHTNKHAHTTDKYTHVDPHTHELHTYSIKLSLLLYFSLSLSVCHTHTHTHTHAMTCNQLAPKFFHTQKKLIPWLNAKWLNRVCMCVGHHHQWNSLQWHLYFPDFFRTLSETLVSSALAEHSTDNYDAWTDLFSYSSFASKQLSQYKVHSPSPNLVKA